MKDKRGFTLIELLAVIIIIVIIIIVIIILMIIGGIRWNISLED